MSNRPRLSYDVLFYSPWVGPLLVGGRDVAPTGGAETQIFLVAKSLADRGVHVCMVAFAIDGVEIPTRIAGFDIVVRPAYQAKRRVIGKFIEALGIWRALRIVRAEVVVTRAAGPHVGLVALFSKILRRRFVYSSANVSDFNFAVLASKRRDQLLFALGVRMADDIVVQTDEQAAMCQERFIRKPRVIRSIAEAAAVSSSEPEAFLWIGRMVWYKRPLEFVELARRNPDARFWLVGVPVPFSPGGPQLVDAVMEEVADLPNLEMLAPRPRVELMKLIDRAVAIVNTADFEGLPNILLEGWSRGVPALVLTHDPDGIIASEGLGSFAGGDREAFAVSSEKLWLTRHERAELSSRCREFVETRHSASSVGREWEDVLLDRSVPERGPAIAEAL